MNYNLQRYLSLFMAAQPEGALLRAVPLVIENRSVSGIFSFQHSFKKNVFSINNRTNKWFYVSKFFIFCETTNIESFRFRQLNPTQVLIISELSDCLFVYLFTFVLLLLYESNYYQPELFAPQESISDGHATASKARSYITLNFSRVNFICFCSLTFDYKLLTSIQASIDRDRHWKVVSYNYLRILKRTSYVIWIRAYLSIFSSFTRAFV